MIFMTVYIEYVFFENFLIDGMLLYLSFRAVKIRFAWKKLLFSAFIGAVFALLFPLLSLPFFWTQFLKISVGFLLCLLAFPRIKNKNDGGRYALTCAVFFLLSFAFAGAIIALYNRFSLSENGYTTAQTPLLFVLCFATAFFIFILELAKKIYKKQAVFRHIYDCAILYNKRRIAIFGFLDSGNLAKKNGTPVCFLSPEIAFELWENELLTPHGEITVQTLGGEKTLPLFAGDLEIKKNGEIFKRKGVFFAPSAHIVSREYKMLLQANIFDEKIINQRSGL